MTIEEQGVLSLTANAVLAWVDAHADLLDGLVALRALGAQADDAIEAVLAVREIRVLRGSVDLFEVLAGGRGANAWLVLGSAGSDAHVDALAAALFGSLPCR